MTRPRLGQCDAVLGWRGPDKGRVRLCGRGELQISILIEEMRREGFEMTLSPPSVVGRVDDEGEEWEPWELLDIDVPTDRASGGIEAMGNRFTYWDLVSVRRAKI